MLKTSQTVGLAGRREHRLIAGRRDLLGVVPQISSQFCNYMPDAPPSTDVAKHLHAPQAKKKGARDPENTKTRPIWLRRPDQHIIYAAHPSRPTRGGQAVPLWAAPAARLPRRTGFMAEIVSGVHEQGQHSGAARTVPTSRQCI